MAPSPSKRVLIVSPRFAPSNAADSHRVRQALPYFRDEGWDPVVLAVDPHEVSAVQDPYLLETVPSDVEVVRVGALPRAWTERVGIGSLEARSVVPLFRAGRRLLKHGRFDLVFFSTTAMGVTALGPLWASSFGVPYVVDYQDPWVSDYYRQEGAPSPPGGAVKYGLVQAAARLLEPRVLSGVGHVISVSPAYPAALCDRYPWLKRDRFTVLPFGAPEFDFEVLDNSRVPNPVFDADDGFEHWAYVGRAGGDMELSLESLFLALSKARRAEPQRYERVRLHFVGTSYAEGDRAIESVAPVAARCGVGDLVEERPARIPYFEALRVLRDAKALIVPGSDDPGYTASKLYPYVLARRPLLAVFNEASSVVEIIRGTEAGTVVTFASGERPVDVAGRLGPAWFERPLPNVQTDWAAFEPYTACAMAARLCKVFNRTLSEGPIESANAVGTPG